MSPLEPLPIGVYRDDVLPLTNTFVKAQLEAMSAVSPLLVGARRVNGLTVGVPSWVVADGLPVGVASVSVAFYKARSKSRRLQARLRRHGASVLLAHFAQDGYRVLPTARSLDIPLVVVCHGSDVLVSDRAALSGNRGSRSLARHWPRAIAGVDLFVASSHFVASALSRRGVPDRKLVVHYTGIPIPEPSNPRVNGEQPIILFVGRLVANKGADQLLRAFRRLHDPMARLLLVGTGPNERLLRASASDLPEPIRQRIDFLGEVAHDKVHSLMAAAAVVCIPSIQTEDGASEGLSHVALEAQAACVPVVAYRTGGLPEAVADGLTGILVPSGDVDALAAALDYVLRDRATARTLGINGRRRVAVEFDVRRQTERLEQTLLKLAASHWRD